MTDSLVNVSEAEETTATEEDHTVEAQGQEQEQTTEQKLLAGKYKTPEELEKGYKELSKKVREAKPQVPESYSLDAVKDFVGEEQDPVLDDFLGEFKEAGLSQEQADRILKKYYDTMSADAVDPQAELAKLGNDGDKMISGIKNFFAKNKSNFSAEELSAIEGSLITADAVRAVHKMIAATQSKNIPGEGAQVEAESAEEVLEKAQKIMAEERVQYKPGRMAEYQKLMDRYAQLKSARQ